MLWLLPPHEAIKKELATITATIRRVWRLKLSGSSIFAEVLRESA
jgi:hypothetical protein